MKCPCCNGELNRTRLFASPTGRSTCPHCLARIRLRLQHKGGWIAALVVTSPATMILMLWFPHLGLGLLALSSLLTAAIGTAALFALEAVPEA